jgi:hypothetical protein
MNLRCLYICTHRTLFMLFPNNCLVGIPQFLNDFCLSDNNPILFRYRSSTLIGSVFNVCKLRICPLFKKRTPITKSHLVIWGSALISQGSFLLVIVPYFTSYDSCKLLSISLLHPSTSLTTVARDRRGFCSLLERSFPFLYSY